MNYNRVVSLGVSVRVSLEICAGCFLKPLWLKQAFSGSLSREVLGVECAVVLDAGDLSGSLAAL